MTNPAAPVPSPAPQPTPIPRTPDEIVARIKDPTVVARDVFGVERSRYLEALEHEVALPFLQAGTPLLDREHWQKVQMRTTDDVRAQIREYLSFAWQKANGCRALSSARSLAHFAGLLWLLCSEEADRIIAQSSEWSHYGKPQLVMISEMIGFDWRAADDGKWRNHEEDESPKTAAEVLKSLGR